MECNKDEASRAKSIAQAKLEHKDFAGAKNFALKAQNLYPGLDGISQMLTTLDVYISSGKMINRQVDWYGVLGVGPTDDDETIKKQYRKLALVLHPDKNKFTGADGAFKLISEAWSLLSDKAKRSAYNLITGRLIAPMVYTGGRCFQTGASRNYTGSPCVWPGGPPGPFTHSLTKSGKRKPPAPTPQKKSAKTVQTPFQPSMSSANQMVESFWTICGQCKIQYEYHNLYRNMTLLCPNCKTPFIATEIPRPFTKSRSPKSSASVPMQQQQQSSANNNNAYPPPYANNDWGKNVVLDAKKRGLSQGGLNISMHIQNSGAGHTGPNISVHAQQDPLPTPTSVNGAACPLVAKVALSNTKLKWPMHADLNATMNRVTKKRKLDSHDGHII